MSVPLISDFRYHTEPWTSAGESRHAGRLLREEEIRVLARRLQHSTGGTHLVTGYRGVGKTTFVNAALGQLRRSLGQGRERSLLIDVHLAVARAMTGVELMHHMLRGIHGELRSRGLLGRIERGIAEELELAFLRTSAALTLTTSSSTELSGGAGEARIPASKAGRLSLSGKRTRARQREIEYLAYDDRSAEADIIRVARKLRDGVRMRMWRAMGIPWRRRSVRLLIVLDELDKIDDEHGEGEDRASTLDEILRSLKTLFTASGITFVFVAGRDLYDRWLSDLGRGDSVYESIFSDATYVPVAWDQVAALCNPLVRLDGADARESSAFEQFKGFLDFKGRGIPRRILRGFNDHVRWTDAGPTLDLADRRGFAFYAQLRERLREREGDLFGESASDLRPEVRDKQRLGLLYLCDAILHQGAVPFSFETILEISAELCRRIAPDARVAPAVVGALLRLLLENEYLESEHSITQRAGEEAPELYRVPRRRLIEMGRLSDFFEEEQLVDTPRDQPELGARFQPGQLLASGGICHVYEAVDVRSGRSVAIKIGRPEIPALAATSVRNEAEVLAEIAGPGIVSQLYVELDRPRPFLVLERLTGTLLSQLHLPRGGRRAEVVWALGEKILVALERVHQRGYVWRDAKPSNIFVLEGGAVALFDFGVSIREGGPDPFADTTRGVGTIPYLAPELLRGEPARRPADVFGICASFYQLFSGRPPFAGSTPEQLLAAIEAGAASLPPLPRPMDGLPKLIQSGLAPNADGRPSLSELLAGWQAARTKVNLAEEVARSSEQSERTEFTTMSFATVVARPPPSPDASPPTAESEARHYQQLTPEGHGPADPAVERPRLAVNTQDELSYFSLAGLDECRIGRSDSNELQIPDDRVSRFHAVIHAKEAGHFVEELNSRNGVKLNDAWLEGEPAALSDGDRLLLGGTEIEYEA